MTALNPTIGVDRTWRAARSLLALACALGIVGCAPDDDDDATSTDPTPADASEDWAVLQGVLSSHGLVHETMFSVAPGATGLPDSGVASVAPNAQSHLFTSPNKGPSHIQGTNEVLARPAELDLLETDDLNAVSTLHHPRTLSPWYFSVFDEPGVDEGLEGTGVRDQSDVGEDPGDVFYSGGFGAKGAPGTNFLFTDEIRMGIQPSSEGAAPRDDLNAVDFVYTTPPGLVFFSVGRGTVGTGAVNEVDEALRPCTVFRTMIGSGQVDVAYTCDQLGLAAGDNLDALVVRGATQAETVYFSVDATSSGADTTNAVRSEATSDGAEGDIFRSTGGGTNTLAHEEVSLGLEDAPTRDELDALTIAELSLAGYITRLPPPPEDPPPWTNPPPELDTGDSEQVLVPWELVLLGGPRTRNDWEKGASLPHPCTTCGLADRPIQPDTAIQSTQASFGAIPGMFGPQSPVLNFEFGQPADLTVDGSLGVSGAVVDLSADTGAHVNMVITDAPFEPASGRRQETACGLALRDAVYSAPPPYTEDFFNGHSTIIVSRFDEDSGDGGLSTLSVGADGATEITEVEVRGLVFTNNFGTTATRGVEGDGGSISIVPDEDLADEEHQQNAVDPTPIYWGPEHSSACWTWNVPSSDPFGVNTNDFSYTSDPPPDRYQEERNVEINACQFVEGGSSVQEDEGAGGTITLQGLGDDDPEEISISGTPGLDLSGGSCL